MTIIMIIALKKLTNLVGPFSLEECVRRAYNHPSPRAELLGLNLIIPEFESARVGPNVWDRV